MYKYLHEHGKCNSGISSNAPLGSAFLWPVLATTLVNCLSVPPSPRQSRGQLSRMSRSNRPHLAIPTCVTATMKWLTFSLLRLGSSGQCKHSLQKIACLQENKDFKAYFVCCVIQAKNENNSYYKKL